MVKFKGSSAEDKIPAWLKTIQENSWEAELLLSAVLLFGLIQTPIFLETWLKQTFIWESNQIIGFVEKFIKGIEILRVGFIFHIIVRALWIAQVGFSYVFPKGILVDKLKFKGRFRTELNKPDGTVKSILTLEKIASTIFAISFSLFGLLIGFLSFFSPLILIALLINGKDISSATETGLLIFLLIYFLLSFIVFIDFVTNGIFRRGRRRAKFYYPIAYVFRFFTLSFLYKKTLLTIISNVNGYKRYLITIGMVLVIVWIDKPNDLIMEIKVDHYAANTKRGFVQKTNYESKRAESDLLVATIPSDIIQEGVLSIYIKHQNIFRFKDLKKDTVRRNLRFNSGLSVELLAEESKRLSEILTLKLDQQPMDCVQWMTAVHPKTYERGFVGYLNIDNLNNSLHQLTIELRRDTLINNVKRDSLLANIPFYKTH